MKNFMFLISLFLVISCIDIDNSPKKFLFEHPEIKFQINQTGKIYDKYSFPSQKGPFIFRSIICYETPKVVLTVFVGQEKYDIFLTRDFQRIGNTKYGIKFSCYHEIEFKVMETNIQTLERVQVVEQYVEQETLKTHQPQKRKESFKMSLSLGTWILLIIVMIIVAKVAHKLRLRLLFGPTKKATIHIKKEWDDA